MELRAKVPLGRRQPPEPRTFRAHAVERCVAPEVEVAEVELRCRRALRGRQTIQARALCVVLRHALALGVDDAEVALRCR